MSKFPCFSLTLEPMPGSELEHCCNQAQALANDLQVIVRFTFNGVNCNARPGGDQVAMASNLMAMIGRQVTTRPHQEAWS